MEFYKQASASQCYPLTRPWEQTQMKLEPRDLELFKPGAGRGQMICLGLSGHSSNVGRFNEII